MDTEGYCILLLTCFIVCYVIIFIKIYILCLYYDNPWGSGWIIWIWLGKLDNSSNYSESSLSIEYHRMAIIRPLRLISCSTLLLYFFPCSLISACLSVSLSYFILAVPMHQCSLLHKFHIFHGHIERNLLFFMLWRQWRIGNGSAN